jgi:hypothetical protein
MEPVGYSYSPNSHLDIDWVDGRLVVGAAFSPNQVGLLKAHGVGAVLDLRAEAADDPDLLRKHEIDFLHLGVPDGEAPSLTQLLRGIAWVREQWARGRSVLVHCQGGLGRSPCFATALLVAEGLPLEEAFARVKAARRAAALTASQWDALRRFASEAEVD